MGKESTGVSQPEMFVIICVPGYHVNRMQKPGKREESKIGQVVWEKQGMNCNSRGCEHLRREENIIFALATFPVRSC